jgi:DNA polymerase/3'-5' exonuclease PolX
VKLYEAQKIAARVVAELAPHCARIEVAGSVRRCKPEVGDIEIVCIPLRHPCGLFGDEWERDPGFVAKVNQWPAVRGKAEGKYTQRTLPEGIALDLFTATADNWGLIYAIRTGSADYSHRVLASGWVRNGYVSSGGMITKGGVPVKVREEWDLFTLAGVKWVPPEARS